MNFEDLYYEAVRQKMLLEQQVAEEVKQKYAAYERIAKLIEERDDESKDL
jgi:predicted transport protein